jgi:hypothetical protein
MMKSATVDNGIDADAFAEQFDEWLFNRFGVKAVVGTLRHWFIESIADTIGRCNYECDDSYWKWAERHLSDEEYSDFCKRQNQFVRESVRKIRRLKRQALVGGFITRQEYATL